MQNIRIQRKCKIYARVMPGKNEVKLNKDEVCYQFKVQIAPKCEGRKARENNDLYRKSQLPSLISTTQGTSLPCVHP